MQAVESLLIQRKTSVPLMKTASEVLCNGFGVADRERGAGRGGVRRSEAELLHEGGLVRLEDDLVGQKFAPVGERHLAHVAGVGHKTFGVVELAEDLHEAPLMIVDDGKADAASGLVLDGHDVSYELGGCDPSNKLLGKSAP